MTGFEFSNQFDVAYSNIMSNEAPGLNEYEKSVFLTKAQNELILNYFNPKSKGNSVQEGFDDSAIRQMDFSSLVIAEKQAQPTLTDASGVARAYAKVDPRGVLYNFPGNALIIINEVAQLKKSDADDDTLAVTRQVIPINFREYQRLMSKPFKEPLKWQAWRLINQIGSTNSTNTSTSTVCELVFNTRDTSVYSGGTFDYVVRYVKKPRPIILVDLSDTLDNLTIEGKSGSETEYNLDNGYTTNPCELNEVAQEAILQRAVELAKIAWAGDANAIQLQMASGQRSE